MTEEDAINDLKAGTNFVRYEIVQASYQHDTENYKLHITQGHLSNPGILPARHRELQ